MKKKETVFSEWVIKTLKKEFGNKILIENIDQCAKSGTPDFLCCLNGRFIALELKTDTGVVSKIQLVKMLDIRLAGGYSCVVTPSNFDNTLKALKKISTL